MFQYYPEFIRLVAETSKKTKSNAAAIKASFDSLNQIIKIMLRVISSSRMEEEGQQRPVESVQENKHADITKCGLMRTTLQIFHHGVSANTYKVIRNTFDCALAVIWWVHIGTSSAITPFVPFL